jgi:hypothetical protein
MPRKPYQILGKSNDKTENIDATCGENDARYLVSKYQREYGNQWEIWAQDKDGNKLLY